MKHIIRGLMLVTGFACAAHAGDGVQVSCHHHLGITSAGAESEDWAGRNVAWSAVLTGGAVVISRRKSCGDECSRLDEIRLAPIKSDCPTSAVVRSVVYDYGSPSPEAEEKLLDRGEIQLQDWGGEVVSGRFEGEVTWSFHAFVNKP